ncbi:leucyl/phenylalanyl-tRNA--protein transferase [Saccharospirillum impatiens]|uniref:leucyl/phenylalanyl-tRNA--protein transferase n=1 Tax=Saccharospirillum impatiens TaxID=169438 RepID=UPI00041A7043|nr:leucyl/phenylalanyl-tRNA--protein transferase [Saccharospirillum impatiens]
MPQLSWLDAEQDVCFPPTDQGLVNPPGLLAAGGSLTPDWLLTAYERGIFPWYSEGEPILWWSPEPRMVLIPGDMHVSRSLRKAFRHEPVRITLNTAFAEVIAACQAPRAKQPGTWISSEMREAYTELHQLGWAHSIEVWRKNVLVGGLYGIGIEGVFYGESMFSRHTNGSKFALLALQEAALMQSLRLIDCQVYNDHLASLGAREVERPWFEQQLPRQRRKLSLPEASALNQALVRRLQTSVPKTNTTTIPGTR